MTHEPLSRARPSLETICHNAVMLCLIFFTFHKVTQEQHGQTANIGALERYLGQIDWLAEKGGF